MKANIDNVYKLNEGKLNYRLHELLNYAQRNALSVQKAFYKRRLYD